MNCTQHNLCYNVSYGCIVVQPFSCLAVACVAAMCDIIVCVSFHANLPPSSSRVAYNVAELSQNHYGNISCCITQHNMYISGDTAYIRVCNFYGLHFNGYFVCVVFYC